MRQPYRIVWREEKLKPRCELWDYCSFHHICSIGWVAHAKSSQIAFQKVLEMKYIFNKTQLWNPENHSLWCLLNFNFNHMALLISCELYKVETCFIHLCIRKIYFNVGCMTLLNMLVVLFMKLEWIIVKTYFTLVYINYCLCT